MMLGLGLADGIQIAAIIGGSVATIIIIFAALRGNGSGSRKGAHSRHGLTRRDRRVSDAGHDRRQGIDRRSSYRRTTDPYDRRRDLFTAQQVRAVTGASFQRRQILNIGEYRVFRIIETELISIRRGYRAFAQTSLGEILNSANDDAFFAINAKRVDILIVDRGGWPVLAIEYQGAGHYQGTAIARDTIKVTALNNAGVGYIEIFESDGDEQIRIRLREHLARISDNQKTAASTAPSRLGAPIPGSG